ncbi:MAG TPA: folylpolyglutamate synthase/dihydrofolate synthase family protein [Candidatus Binatia bacterium]
MKSYSETLNTIYNLRGGEVDLRLHRVTRALALFGHPERRFPSFHIAGTNGKGSTAAMLHGILCAQGYRAALYTSPHLSSFTERMRVGDGEITPEEVVELAEALTAQLDRAGIALTFFEFVTVMALVYFARSEIDVAVVEVGLGGRLDATNLVHPKVSIITTIAKDHEAYLGSDLESIAREKGGIIKDGIPVIGGPLAPEARAVIETLSQAHKTKNYFLGRDFSVTMDDTGQFDYEGPQWHLKELSVALHGAHQRNNAALALAALEVSGRDFPVEETAVREGLKEVIWPGRLEMLGSSPTVILDGAHNMEGVEMLVREIRALAGDRRVHILFGAMGDKDWQGMLKELARVAYGFILTRAPMERSVDPQALCQSLPPGVSGRAVDDPLQAAVLLLESAAADDVVLVTGSIYLLGEVRPFLLRAMKPCATAAGRPGAL